LQPINIVSSGEPNEKLQYALDFDEPDSYKHSTFKFNSLIRN